MFTGLTILSLSLSSIYTFPLPSAYKHLRIAYDFQSLNAGIYLRPDDDDDYDESATWGAMLGGVALDSSVVRPAYDDDSSRIVFMHSIQSQSIKIQRIQSQQAHMVEKYVTADMASN